MVHHTRSTAAKVRAEGPSRHYRTRCCLQIESMLQNDTGLKRVRASIHKHYRNVGEFVQDFMLHAGSNGFDRYDKHLKGIIPQMRGRLMCQIPLKNCWLQGRVLAIA